MKVIICFIVAVSFLGMAPSAVLATPVLDQEYIATDNNIGPTPWNPGTPVDWSQTFTAGLDGILDRVELKVRRYATTTLPLLVDIRTLTPGGAPTEDNAGPNVLGSVIVDPSAVSTSFSFASIDFSPFSIAVSSGDRLAIVIRSNVIDTDYELQGNNPGGYGSGGLYLRWSGTGSVWGKHSSMPNADITFRTYVAPIPEPEQYALILVGLGLVSWATRYKKSSST